MSNDLPAKAPDKKLLCLQTIALLTGGAVGAQFDDDLKRAVRDCEDRPTDKRPRTVALLVRLSPEVDLKNGKVHCDDVLVEAQIKTGLPQRHSPVYRMKPRHGHGELFIPEGEDLGPGLFDEIEEDEPKRGLDNHP